MDGIETAPSSALQTSRAALIYQSEGEIVGGTETTVIRRRPVVVGQPVRSGVEHFENEQGGDIARVFDADAQWFVLELEPCGTDRGHRPSRGQAVETSARGADGSWELPLTPALARQLAEHGISLKCLHQAAREARRQGGTEPVLRISLALR